MSKDCGLIDLDTWQEGCVYSDFGIAQVNYKTAKHYKMSLTELLTNLEYSVYSGARALSWFKRKYAHKEQHWWVRYNCGTKASINRTTCNDYKRRVSRWL